ncbi:carbohydrate esterase [Achlya hypogyna]|uniref:Carbohydrate esterase n=1 Tax=Achlya hypogyna TaxID=1202772 RepID=A0A1V9Z9W1_ACHHY|nr:carbohydrate esterase [Achlya hypogyna]
MVAGAQLARRPWRASAWKLLGTIALYNIWNHLVLVGRTFGLLRRRFPAQSLVRTFVAACIYTLTVELGELGNIVFGMGHPRLVRRTLASSFRLRTNDFKYGPHERHALDLFGTTRSGSRRPVVIFIHGGAWAMTNKFHYAAVGQELSKHGVLTVVANYRVFPHGDVEDMLEDLEAIVQWTVENAPKHGGDVSNITLSGHSSGAHVASLVLLKSALRIAAKSQKSFEVAPRIKAFVGLSGPYDMDDHYAFESQRRIAVFRAHAISPLHPSMHGRAQFPRFSPSQLVLKNLPLPRQICLFHGVDDVVVPISSTQRFASQLREHGTPVEVVELPCGHVEPLLALMGEDAALQESFFASFLPLVQAPRWPPSGHAGVLPSKL